MYRVAVDAMGGDHAPRVVVKGVFQAAELFDDLELTLVGPEDTLEAELNELGLSNPRVKVVDAPEVVGMNEAPVVALRRKPRSTIRVMTSLLKAGECDAVFSAGNTGAMVAASTMLLGLLPGVRRAGIAVSFPTGKRNVVLIDVGANVQCKPVHLFQYGLMAGEFVSRVYAIESPKVGLLNVGEEEQKGNQLVKETQQLFTDSKLAFVGNVEGRDIFHGDCDVVVCDGFVGNIVLKVSEGLSERLVQFMKQEIASIDDMTGHSGPIHDALGTLAQLVDYAEYGGAPLLGVNGTVIIGHGRSDAKAVTNALRWVREMQRVQINDRIAEAIKEAVV